MLRSFIISIFLLAIGGSAYANEAVFFNSVEGKWTGPGEIVAGKYKGTKFTCVFDGLDVGRATALKIDGYCRVGVFSQPMNALVEKAGSGYRGKFLDGEKGEGMDIVGGSYSKDKLVVNIRRKDLNGVMVTRRTGNDKLQFTISVRVDGKLVPVIGMRLDRASGGDPKVANKS